MDNKKSGTLTRISQKETNQTVNQAIKSIKRAGRSPIKGWLEMPMRNPIIQAMNLNLRQKIG